MYEDTQNIDACCKGSVTNINCTLTVYTDFTISIHTNN